MDIYICIYTCMYMHTRTCIVHERVFRLGLPQAVKAQVLHLNGRGLWKLLALQPSLDARGYQKWQPFLSCLKDLQRTCSVRLPCLWHFSAFDCRFCPSTAEEVALGHCRCHRHGAYIERTCDATDRFPMILNGPHFVIQFLPVGSETCRLQADSPRFKGKDGVQWDWIAWQSQ